MTWTCVKDSLPNPGDIVLTYWNSGKYCVMCFCSGNWWFSEKGDYINVYQERGAELFECITHWQPLPNKPEVST